MIPLNHLTVAKRCSMSTMGILTQGHHPYLQRKENDSGRSVPAQLRIWVRSKTVNQRCNFEALPLWLGRGLFFPRSFV